MTARSVYSRLQTYPFVGTNDSAVSGRQWGTFSQDPTKPRLSAVTSCSVCRGFSGCDTDRVHGMHAIWSSPMAVASAARIAERRPASRAVLGPFEFSVNSAAQQSGHAGCGGPGRTQGTKQWRVPCDVCLTVSMSAQGESRHATARRARRRCCTVALSPRTPGPGRVRIARPTQHAFTHVSAPATPAALRAALQLLACRGRRSGGRASSHRAAEMCSSQVQPGK